MAIIDLFSGSGSASEPWLQDGFKVARYDILTGWDLSDRAVCDDIIKRHKDEVPLLIWASPPCVSYSRLRQTTGHAYEPDLTLWRAAKRIIAAIRPIYYCIENVGGAVRSWGKPRQIIGAYYLWGNYPLISPPKVPPKKMHEGGGAARAARAARIPPALAIRLKETILAQYRLI